MEKDFIEQMKQRLLEEQKDLKARLGRFTTKDPNVKGNYDAKFPKYSAEDETDAEDFEESAHEVQDYTDAIGVENVLELRLATVDRALQRIEQGTYGACSNCKATQFQQRLEADPAAEQCPDCGRSK